MLRDAHRSEFGFRFAAAVGQNEEISPSSYNASVTAMGVSSLKRKLFVIAYILRSTARWLSKKFVGVLTDPM